VVVENNSPDDTENIITSSNNDRISYYKNKTNIVINKNIIKTIKLAKGRWVFLISDEDAVVKDAICDIISDISNGRYSETAVIMGNIKRIDGSYYEKYNDAYYLRGDEAIGNVGFSHHYMSGIMINKRYILEEELEKLTQESDEVYPHIKIFTRACLGGSAIVLDKNICIMMEPRAKKALLKNQMENYLITQ